MNYRYTIGWLLLAAFVLAIEFVAPAANRDAMRIIAIIYFVILEGLAIRRVKPGDTLSEHVWEFYNRQQPARISLVVSWVAYAFAAIMDIAVDPDLMVGRVPVTVAVLSIGLAGWLIPHFIFRGKYG